MRRFKLMLTTALAAGLVQGPLSACGPAYYVEAEHDPVVAPGPPPEDRYEDPGPPPWPGAVWTSGYWMWDGDEYVWVSGGWSRPPRATMVWVPSGYVFVGGRYRFVPGRWAHPSRVPRYDYYRPARPVHRPHPPHHPHRH